MSHKIIFFRTHDGEEKGLSLEEARWYFGGDDYYYRKESLMAEFNIAPEIAEAIHRYVRERS